MEYKRDLDSEFEQLTGNQLTLDNVVIREHILTNKVKVNTIDFILLRLNNFKLIKQNSEKYIKLPNGRIIQSKWIFKNIRVTLLEDIVSKYDIYKSMHKGNLSWHELSIVTSDNITNYNVKKKLIRNKLYVCIKLSEWSYDLGLYPDAITDKHKKNINNIFQISILKDFQNLNEIYYDNCLDNYPIDPQSEHHYLQYMVEKRCIPKVTVNLLYFSHSIENNEPIIIDDCGRKIKEELFEKEFKVIIKEPIIGVSDKLRTYSAGDRIPFTIDKKNFDGLNITLNFKSDSCVGIDKEEFDDLTMYNMNNLFVIKWEKSGNIPESYYISNALKEVAADDIKNYIQQQNAVIEKNDNETKVLSLETDTIEGIEKVKTEYQLIGELNNLYGVKIDSYIVKRIDEIKNNIYSLTKYDCKVLGIEFQRGLQLIPKNIGWMEESKEEAISNIENDSDIASWKYGMLNRIENNTKA